MQTYKIHLIRHGLTQANLDGVYCGSTDLPLCEEGLRDLHSLVGEYSYPYIDALYVSPLVRARQTASLLFPDIEQQVIDGLRESSFGVYEGKSFSELKDSSDFREWVVFGSDRLPQGAEDPKKFQRRSVESFLSIVDDMMRAGAHSAAVVTHAGVIANILGAVAFPKKSPYDWQCIPGCGYTVMADPSLYLREPVVEVISWVPEDLDA